MFFGITMLASVAISMKSVLTADQVLAKAEAQLKATSIIAEMKVSIQRPKWTKTMRLKTWGKGNDYALAYILGPEKDKGTVYLKNATGVYNYLPKINRTVKLPNALLNQNWMGTDMSTDDIVKLSRLKEDYNAKMMGTKSILGKSCYWIELTPKDEADVLWGKLELFIDKQDFLQMRAIFYDEDMEAVNQLETLEVKKIGGKTVAAKMKMIPSNKSGHSTVVEYESIQFNKPISSSFFTKENMSKVAP